LLVLRSNAFARLTKSGPGSCEFDPVGLSPLEFLCVAGAGPLATAALAAAECVAALAASGFVAQVLWACAVLDVLALIYNLIPVGFRDGARMRRSLTAHREFGSNGDGPFAAAAVSRLREMWASANANDQRRLADAASWTAPIWQVAPEGSGARKTLMEYASLGFLCRFREGIAPLPKRLAAELAARRESEAHRNRIAYEHSLALGVTPVGEELADRALVWLAMRRGWPGTTADAASEAFASGRAMADMVPYIDPEAIVRRPLDGAEAESEAGTDNELSER
jgi:hypothetical protein